MMSTDKPHLLLRNVFEKKTGLGICKDNQPGHAVINRSERFFTAQYNDDCRANNDRSGRERYCQGGIAAVSGSAL